MNKKHQVFVRGFTLIELLVVIAIIGILAAVVLVSLNQARVKANYAQIQSDMNTIQTQAGNWYSDNSDTYGPTTATSTAACTTANSMFTDTAVTNAVAQIQTIPGATITCGIASDFYDVIVTDAITGDWCINSEPLATSTTSC